MNINFEEKVVLITGAASGIGRAAALKYAEAGANVVISDIDKQGCEETASLISRTGGQASFIQSDVTKSNDASKMVDFAVDTYGKLDIAFNNAGIAKPGVLPDVDEAEWDRIMDIDLKGVWLCMKYQIPELLKQTSSVIINTSSMAGLVGTPSLGVYSAAKAGVIALTKCAALDYAKTGLRINAVCPGVIDTPFLATGAEVVKEISQSIPMGRLGTAEEIANSVLWLSSDYSSYTTGTAMVIDGAFTVP